MYQIEKIMNKILQGHNLEVIGKIPTASIDLKVSSPPYYYQRDYKTTLVWWNGIKDCEHEPIWYKQKKKTWGKPNEGTDGKLQTKTTDNFQFIPEKEFAFCKCGAWLGQLGLEPIPDMYLDHLFQIFNQCIRVLKDEGSFWLNIGDKYVDNVLLENFAIFEKMMEEIGKKVERENYLYPSLKEKSLIGIPDYVKVGLMRNGLICRNDIIWHKPDAMPSSVKDRFTDDYERIFFFTKNKKYYFEQQLEEAKELRRWGKEQTKSKYKVIEKATYHFGKKNKYGNIEVEAKHRQGMHKERGMEEIVFRPNLPDKDYFIEKLRNNLRIDEIVLKTNIKRTTVEHWFRKDEYFSYPTKDDWNTILEKFIHQIPIPDRFPELLETDTKLDTVDYSGESKGEKDEVIRLRNKRTVWSILTASYSGSHFAVFPEELVKIPILACCPPEGIVLDCFFGRGTTGKVARKLGRNYIGIDLNPDYIHQAKRFINQKKRLTEFV